MWEKWIAEKFIEFCADRSRGNLGSFHMRNGEILKVITSVHWPASASEARSAERGRAGAFLIRVSPDAHTYQQQPSYLVVAIVERELLAVFLAIECCSSIMTSLLPSELPTPSPFDPAAPSNIASGLITDVPPNIAARCALFRHH